MPSNAHNALSCSFPSLAFPVVKGSIQIPLHQIQLRIREKVLRFADDNGGHHEALLLGLRYHANDTHEVRGVSPSQAPINIVEFRLPSLRRYGLSLSVLIDTLSSRQEDHVQGQIRQPDHPICSTSLLRTPHQDHQHCLGRVLADLHNRPWHIHSGTMDPHQTLMPTAVLLPVIVLGAPVLLKHPLNRGGSLGERIRGQIRISWISDYSVCQFWLDAVLLAGATRWPPGNKRCLVPETSNLKPQTCSSALRTPPPVKLLQAYGVAGGSIGIPRGAQVTIAMVAGHPGTRS